MPVVGGVISRPTDSVIFRSELPRLELTLNNIDKALKRDQTKTGLAIYSNKLQQALTSSITRVALSGYTIGAKQVLYPEDTAIGLRIRRDAAVRAKQATEWITATTGKALDIESSFNIKQAISRLRTITDANNELGLAWYMGVRQGWTLNPLARKEWWVGNAHDVDDICDDNMDEGPIKPSEAFQSGDFEPPAHLYCDCNLVLSMMKG